MGPEDESVEKAEERYMFVVQHRHEAAERARKEEWDSWELRVYEARTALTKARDTAEANALLKRALELLLPQSERVNGL